MAGTFFGINVAQSGLAAQRTAMDLLSQNIAHANDPTYKRQRLVMVEGMPLAQSQESSPGGTSTINAGVQTGAFQRVRDALIEHRMLEANDSTAQWDFMNRTLTQLEAVLGEPSDTGLQADIDQFWNSWQQVATTPDNQSIRSTLLENADALCSRMQYTYRQISDNRDDLNLTMVNSVNSINLMAEELARINSEVAAMSSGEFQTNDLLNRRDALVQEMSKIVSLTQHGEDGEDFVLSIGGRILVQGTQFNQLSAVSDVNGNQQVEWAEDGQPLVIQGGQMKALVDIRDTMIPSYLSQLDAVASSLVNEVNTLHHTGLLSPTVNGGDFFTAGGTAANISLDATIVGQPNLIAASSNGSIGNGNIAQAIAQLKNQPIMATGLSINQMYRALVGDIAGATAMSEKQSTAHNLSLQQFQTQQQAISGVSLDEEMTNMIKFQQAYNASARSLTVMDEMLSTLIERTGTVGR